MRDYIEERAKQVGTYITNNSATIRKTAAEFGYGKSTIYKDCVERLPKINPLLANTVRSVLDYNKEARSVRG